MRGHQAVGVRDLLSRGSSAAPLISFAIMTPGIQLLHKPVGPTSFSIVKSCLDSLRSDRGRKTPRLCHGGTLDPFASGLLLLLVEPATRLFDYLHDIPKTYEAVVRWGTETDNGDPHGNVIRTGDASHLTPALLDETLASFVGWREQTPHATSARRVDGERAYVRVHRGETVVMQPAQVYLHEAAWLSHDLPYQSVLRMTAKGGYYVRALARDLGQALGCGAHLSQLRRAAIGPWRDPGVEQSTIVTGEAIMPWLPRRELSDQDVGDLRQDTPISTGECREGSWTLPQGFPSPRQMVRGFHRNRFCFLLTRDNEKLLRAVNLHGGV